MRRALIDDEKLGDVSGELGTYPAQDRQAEVDVREGSPSSHHRAVPDHHAVDVDRDTRELPTKHRNQALLDNPLPWTKMRQVYRLIGLVTKWGAPHVEKACRRALDAEAIDVNLVSRMLERAREDAEPGEVPPAVVVQGRFSRNPSEFATNNEVGR